MNFDFESVHNYNEQAVIDLVMTHVRDHEEPWTSQPELVADVVCVALNRLPPRYIRHNVDFVFYQTDAERLAFEKLVTDAVTFALNFVRVRQQARLNRLDLAA